MIPAITSILAKIMILTDEILGFFVTVQTNADPDNCAINYMTGSLTVCGQNFVDYLDQLIYSLVQLGANVLPALGVLVPTG
jgi:hypothetical protein